MDGGKVARVDQVISFRDPGRKARSTANGRGQLLKQESGGVPIQRTIMLESWRTVSWAQLRSRLVYNIHAPLWPICPNHGGELSSQFSVAGKLPV